jgi:CAAX prenyl protease-like protein
VQLTGPLNSLKCGWFSWLSFAITSVLFGLMHGQAWLPGTLAGMAFALALRRRGQLLDAVVAHATANGLLAAYVLLTGNWAMWS